jgi:hypothetical protein
MLSFQIIKYSPPCPPNDSAVTAAVFDHIYKQLYVVLLFHRRAAMVRYGELAIG